VAGIVAVQFDHPDGHRLFPGDIVGLVDRTSTTSIGFLRRTEQGRHPCKSTKFSRLSGEASSKEQAFGGREQESGLMIQGVNRRSTGTPPP
jgi:hypothetical protein